MPRAGSAGNQLGDIVLFGVVVPLARRGGDDRRPAASCCATGRYNDVLDGATFGVASAVAFVGAQVIAGSLDLFAGGPTPVGEPLPWVARIVSIAVALPVVAAGSIGSAVGAFSLRYRAPVRDRAPWRSPAVRRSRSSWPAPCSSRPRSRPTCPGRSSTSRSSSGLAAVALVWLRRTLHLGLLEEAFEVEVGPEIVCANCGRPTRRHTFCGEVRDRAPGPARSGRDARRRAVTGSNVPTGRRARVWRTGFAPAPSGRPTGRARTTAPPLGPDRVRLSSSAPFSRSALLLAFALGRPGPAARLPARDRVRRTAGAGTGRQPGARRPARTDAPGSAGSAGVPPGTIGIRAGTPWISRSSATSSSTRIGGRSITSNEDPREADLDYQGSVRRRACSSWPRSRHREADPQAYAGPLARPAPASSAPDLKADGPARRTRSSGRRSGSSTGSARTYAGSLDQPAIGDRHRSGSAWSWRATGGRPRRSSSIVWNPDKSVGSKWLQYNIRSRAELDPQDVPLGPVVNARRPALTALLGGDGAHHRSDDHGRTPTQSRGPGTRDRLDRAVARPRPRRRHRWSRSARHRPIARSPSSSCSSVPGRDAMAAYAVSVGDPASPDYRRFLRADEIGARFGLADADLARVTAWAADARPRRDRDLAAAAGGQRRRAGRHDRAALRRHADATSAIPPAGRSRRRSASRACLAR